MLVGKKGMPLQIFCFDTIAVMHKTASALMGKNTKQLQGKYMLTIITINFSVGNHMRQRARVVRVPDLKSGDPEFGSRSDH